MKIYILDPVDESVISHARDKYEVIAYPESRDSDWHNDAAAVIVRTYVISRDDIARAKNLKIIAKHGVGVDNIDVACAKEFGIAVTNTPSANAISVAEYVLTLTLALYRNVKLYPSKLLAGDFRAEPAAFELSGKRVGLIGLGDIGGRVANMFSQGFGASVSAYDPYASDETFNKYGVTQSTDINDLLRTSDIISLHVPLTSSTRNLIASEQLRLMKKNAVLINVARGGVVDEDALYIALKHRDIFAAACDVFLSEPVPASHPLLTLDNFLGSPHVAGTSNESLIRMGMGALANIDAVLNGKNAINQL